MAGIGGAETPAKKWGWGLLNTVVVIYALIPVLWIVSLSFKSSKTLADGNFIPREWSLENYQNIFSTSEFTRALVNSIGIAIIATAIAVVFGTMAAYAIARPDPAVHHVRAAARDLHPVGVLPRDPLGAREGGQDGRSDAGAGVPPRHRAAGRTGRVHDGDPGVHLLLERLPVRDLAHVDR